MARPTKTPKSLRMAAATALLAVTAISALAPATAQSYGYCEEEGMNMQCNEFGTIKMENQRDIKGKPITMDVTTTIHQTYAEQGGRWILFSVRHEAQGTSSPISMQLVEFKSQFGDIVTTRVEQDVPNEINAWVHVVDVPTDTPITMTVKVGSSDRGAFRLESLVMPFDRGYEPVYSSTGQELTLYAFTILGVNDASGKVGAGGSFVDGVRTPGFTVGAVLLGALVVAGLVGRRRA